MEVSVTVKTDLRTFRRLPSFLRQELVKAGRLAGRRVVGTAREHAPKRTGAMAAGLDFQVAGSGGEVRVDGYGEMPYTEFQERRAGFFEKALEQEAAYLDRVVDTAAGRAAEKASR